MMDLLMPLGLLGLLGIIALIIIYILKPNYQQKVISSTHVWKLSLRYRRKQLPINRLLSLLILLCQILVITACAMILAQPFIPSEEDYVDSERILVIDASADMRATNDGTTRFERAVEQVYAYSSETLMQQDGIVTVILAGDEASVLVRRADATRRAEVLDLIDGLLGEDDSQMQCTYAQADVDGAMRLAEEILQINPLAQVLFYTATSYADPGPVTVVDVSEEGEWNVGLIDASVALEENYYTFSVDIAAYGRSTSVILSCEVYRADGDPVRFTLDTPAVFCTDGVTTTVEFRTRPSSDADGVEDGVSYDGDVLAVWSDVHVNFYDRVTIYIQSADASSDSFSYDDRVELYGGRPETLNILYASSTMTSFFSNMLSILRMQYSLAWTINITEVRTDQLGDEELATSGYDFYIYETTMPDTLPTDGVVFLVNPQSSPSDAGFEVDTRGSVSAPDGYIFSVTGNSAHPLMEGLSASESDFPITAYMPILSWDNYETLLSVGEDPILLVRNDVSSKVVVMPFSVNDSTAAIQLSLPTLIYNMFNYFFPSAVTDADGTVASLFEVGEEITLNARGPALTVTLPSGETVSYESFPTVFTPDTYGLYGHSQQLISGNLSEGSFYVKVAASESDLTRAEAELPEIVVPIVSEEDTIQDLLLYFAIALAALLFLEWLLQVKENY